MNHEGSLQPGILHSSFNPSDNVVANPYLIRASHMGSKEVYLKHPELFPAG
jgi:hypothetical protein